MNSTIAGISYRAVIGRRRIWLLVLLPAALLGLAVLLRLVGSADERSAVVLMQTFAIGTMLPLVGLIVGTGVIGPEVDDGTIVHLLAKPISRPVIAQTKFLVAASLLAAFAAVPTFLASYLLVGTESGVATGFGLGALAGGIAYAAVFLLLGVLTKHAVAVGIVYALVWEGLVGSLVPGARQFSIQQWAKSIADQISTSAFLETDVALSFAVPALIVVTVGTVVWAGQRLRSFSLTGDE
ncbi:ABC-2 type transport system permease protein [Thermocatellispora tengchongensis]|uniref:ABC-2 type transport system permease protein n=1 Tax=Thermocatellispora tengchongensis TaxID=1073253 RepID=A0A840PN11_9ACTN|nr:ABC transporter permease subunit [Thermocatellispora tengchongensis]MBB5139413.1 ABC-2 type transport system permease protein [Thermocatellispora tengchongensis]